MKNAYTILQVYFFKRTKLINNWMKKRSIIIISLQNYIQEMNDELHLAVSPKSASSLCVAKQIM